MKKGYLSQYFKGVIAKTLSSVEANPEKSNQHEFNGTVSMKTLFGTARKTFTTRFVYMDDDNDPVIDNGFLTWYDAREKHPTRSEYRLFFKSTAVSRSASAGDTLFIALRPDDTILVIIAAANSTISSQLAWLFGIQVDSQFAVVTGLDSDGNRLEFASKLILEQIGIDVDEDNTDYLDEMLSRFGGKFPQTREFSKFARSTLNGLNVHDDPDGVLLSWLEREEKLFKTLEKHLIQQRLAQGFDDVDAFLAYSLSVQNRRKSRVGLALENHFEVVLREYGVQYDRTKVTENRSKPDFIFPGIQQYHDVTFPVDKLTMLGSKSTCKDRWRQVLAEADRINHKHLLTLEAAISTHQTDEMKDKKLQLVIPEAIHKTYTAEQKSWLWDVKSLLAMLLEKQGSR